MVGRLAMILMVGAAACHAGADRPPEVPDSSAMGATQPVCAMPDRTTVLRERDGAILETWALRLEDVATAALPEDPSYRAYRMAIEADGAAVRRPIADPPVIRTEADQEMWRDEDFNNELVFGGTVGSITPISCLDALLFARQAGRVSEIDQPTEFIASVLRRASGTSTDLTVVFGAGSDVFPPREVYGLDVVDSLRAEGWTYWYAIHNHTIQRNGSRLALGVPTPSTSDVRFYRGLAEDRTLQFLRVTNGFFTFEATPDDLTSMRAR